MFSKEQFGQRVKEARIANHETQQDLANESGIGQHNPFAMPPMNAQTPVLRHDSRDRCSKAWW